MKDSEILVNDDGLTLATFKNSNRKSFDKKAFEKEHPLIHEEYINNKKCRTFYLKQGKTL